MVITSFLEIKLAKKYTKYIKNKLILNLGGPVVPLKASSARISEEGIRGGSEC